MLVLEATDAILVITNILLNQNNMYYDILNDFYNDYKL